MWWLTDLYLVLIKIFDYTDPSQEIVIMIILKLFEKIQQIWTRVYYLLITASSIFLNPYPIVTQLMRAYISFIIARAKLVIRYLTCMSLSSEVYPIYASVEIKRFVPNLTFWKYAYCKNIIIFLRLLFSQNEKFFEYNFSSWISIEYYHENNLPTKLSKWLCKFKKSFENATLNFYQ